LTANAAHLDQITFKPVGDSTAKLSALQTGGIDLCNLISSWTWRPPKSAD